MINTKEIHQPFEDQRVVVHPTPTVLDVVYLLQTLQFAHQLANTPSDEILKQYESQMASAFKPDGVPVTICAYNEQEDLPRLLYALSLSSVPVWPIIINNGSSDATKEIAQSVKVDVIDENKPGLVHAQTAAYRYLKEVKPNAEISLSTDADGIPGKHWVASMVDFVTKLPESGGQAFGLYWYYGGNFISDTLLSGIYLHRIIKNNQNRRPLSAHGGNSGIKFDEEGKIIHNLLNLDTNVTLGNGKIIKEAVMNGGGITVRNMHPRTLSLTRSDRFPTLQAVVNLVRNGQQAVQTAYQDWFQRKPGIDATQSKQLPISSQ